MAIFSKHEVLTGDSRLIPEIAKAINEKFTNEGFEVFMDSLISGGYDISITKSNVFKAVLGMKTALKVTLQPHPGGISFEANVGIFGQQAIPTVISMFFFWPVILTQIWGLIEQSKLDDEALSICKDAMLNSAYFTDLINTESYQSKLKYCTECGAKIKADAKFCPECGVRIIS